MGRRARQGRRWRNGRIHPSVTAGRHWTVLRTANGRHVGSCAAGVQRDLGSDTRVVVTALAMASRPRQVACLARRQWRPLGTSRLEGSHGVILFAGRCRLLGWSPARHMRRAVCSTEDPGWVRKWVVASIFRRGGRMGKALGRTVCRSHRPGWVGYSTGTSLALLRCQNGAKLDGQTSQRDETARAGLRQLHTQCAHA